MFWWIVLAIPGAGVLASIAPSPDILSGRSALKKLRFLSAAPTGPHPPKLPRSFDSPSRGKYARVFWWIVLAIPGAGVLASIAPSPDILSGRSALKKLRFLSAAPTGPHPPKLLRSFDSPSRGEYWDTHFNPGEYWGTGFNLGEYWDSHFNFVDGKLRVGMVSLVLLLLSACDTALETPPRPGDFRPQRIVSLDYCADQYLLQLVGRERILALSPDAEREFSYLREAAAGIPTVRPLAEDVLVLEPDLVIRSFGGGPNAAALYARAGVAVLNIGSAGTIEDVMSVLTDVAAGLGETERGAALLAEMRGRLADLGQAGTGPGPRTLYMTPGGVTTGPGSLVHEMMLAAGLLNYQQLPGWRPIPLEALAFAAPELIAHATFGAGSGDRDRWSAMRHPLARNQLASGEVVPLQGAWTACGGWFVLDAIEALAAKTANAAER